MNYSEMDLFDVVDNSSIGGCEAELTENERSWVC